MINIPLVEGFESKEFVKGSRSIEFLDPSFITKNTNNIMGSGFRDVKKRLGSTVLIMRKNSTEFRRMKNYTEFRYKEFHINRTDYNFGLCRIPQNFCNSVEFHNNFS